MREKGVEIAKSRGAVKKADGRLHVPGELIEEARQEMQERLKLSPEAKTQKTQIESREATELRDRYDKLQELSKKGGSRRSLDH